MHDFNVLSLFDGMSCAQIALERTEINYTNYFASEVDKYARKVTLKNYPNTIELGDVREIKGTDLPKINLLIGGSPCQGFSLAGKQLNFDDPRSALFFEYLRLLEEIKPDYFVLENVKMKAEYRDKISELLGVEPILINSSLVSAQNRQRYYWTNIEGIEQPKDRGIYLQDIIESVVVDRDKSFCIDANYFKGGNLKSYFEKHRRQLVFNKPFRISQGCKGGQGQRVYAVEGKSICLSANSGGWGGKTGIYYIDNGYRKLTPREAERLQTVPDDYSDCVSNTQRYKMLGNGFTVDVIAHILSYIKRKSDA